MFKTFSRYEHKYLLWLVVFAVVLSPMYLSLSCSINRQTSVANIRVDKESNISPEHDNVADIEQRARDTAMRSATRMATTGFRPSLEMKENADFLLSPALLMQEILSDEIITTYPSE